MNHGSIEDKLLEIDTRLDGARLVADMPMSQIGRLVGEGVVVILKGAFSSLAAELVSARQAAWSWAATIESCDEPRPDENCHCHQAGVSGFQKTPHVFHSFNFNQLGALPAELGARLRSLYELLAALHADLTGNSYPSLDEVAGDRRRYHPQMIQYPKGGGMFGRHVHQLEPQRVGMITSLTQLGKDFVAGGTGFESDGVVVETEGRHDLGDIVLFRYDLPHWVSPAPTRHNFDWDSDEGRWTMVLPYY